MHKAIKDRLVITGLILLALPLAVFSIPWAHTMAEATLGLCPSAHLTLETTLNVLWLSLAAGTLFGWSIANANRRSGHSGLVSLVFILCLLFPVISASDDLAQLALINDAKTSQSITASINHHKHTASFPGVQGSPALLLLRSNVSLPLISQLASAPDCIASVAAPANTTGNHSPPLG